MGQREDLTANEKIELANKIVAMVEQHYPGEQFDGQEEALVLALIAITSTEYAVNRLLSRT